MVIFIILHCEMEEILILRPKLIHHSNLDETNANHSVYHMAIEIR